MISGDRGGKDVEPSLSIHLFGNVTSKNQMLQKNTWHKILETNFNNGKKYVCISRSFLVIRDRLYAHPVVVIREDSYKIYK